MLPHDFSASPSSAPCPLVMSPHSKRVHNASKYKIVAAAKGLTISFSDFGTKNIKFTDEKTVNRIAHRTHDGRESAFGIFVVAFFSEI